MFDKIKVKNKRPTTIAYIEHRGKYSDIPYEEYIDKLYKWSKEKRAKPGMRPMSIYRDDPDKTPESERRTDVAIPIRKYVAGKGEIKVKNLPAEKVVTMKFKGSPDEYERAYGEMWDWIEEKGYRVSGAPMEVYTGRPKMKREKQIIKSRIEIPIE